MEKFPEFLSEFVLSKEFENEWNKMSQNERENILYFHEDSYFILRKIKEPHELIKIDFVSIINQSDISISNWENFVETFNIPSQFKELPQNKVQLFKQKKTLQDLGYDVNKLNSMSFGGIMYLKELIKLFAENKSTNELLKIINTLNLDIPWHIKHDINFIESKEHKLTSGMKFKI